MSFPVGVLPPEAWRLTLVEGVVQVERSSKTLGSDALETELAVRHADGREGKAAWAVDEQGRRDAEHANGNGKLNEV